MNCLIFIQLYNNGILKFDLSILSDDEIDNAVVDSDNNNSDGNVNGNPQGNEVFPPKNMVKSKHPWKCSICSMEFKHKEQMETHFSTVHEGKKPYDCPDCKKEFTLKRNLYRHSVTTGHLYTFPGKKKGSQEPKFKCEICDNKFMQKTTLNRHVAAIHEGKKPYKCSTCGLAFGYQKTLDRHKLNIHD